MRLQAFHPAEALAAARAAHRGHRSPAWLGANTLATQAYHGTNALYAGGTALCCPSEEGLPLASGRCASEQGERRSRQVTPPSSPFTGIQPACDREGPKSLVLGGGAPTAASCADAARPRSLAIQDSARINGGVTCGSDARHTYPFMHGRRLEDCVARGGDLHLSGRLLRSLWGAVSKYRHAPSCASLHLRRSA